MERNNEVQIATPELTAKELVRANQAKFRANVQEIINHNMERMQEVLNTLDPKEFCDVMIKLMPFGFAKVPDETPKKIETQEDPRLLREIVTREILK